MSNIGSWIKTDTNNVYRRPKRKLDPKLAKLAAGTGDAIGVGSLLHQLGTAQTKKKVAPERTAPSYGLLEQQLLANMTSKPPMVQVPEALRPLSEKQIQSQVQSYISDLLSSARGGYSSALGVPSASSYTMGPGGPQAVPGTELTPQQQLQAVYQGTQGQGANEYTKNLDSAVQWLQGEVSKQPELAWKMAQDLGHDNVTKAKAMVGILKGNQGYVLDWIRMQNTVLNQKGQRDLSAGRLSLDQQKLGLATAKAQEMAGYRQNLLKNANRSYEQQVRAYKDTLAQHTADQRQPSATLSKLYGHIVDSDGAPIPGPDGQPIPVKATTSSRSPYQASVKTAIGLAKEGAKMISIASPGQPAWAKVTQPSATYEDTVSRIVAAITPSMQEAGYGTAVIWGIAQKQANAWYPKKYRPIRGKNKRIPVSPAPRGFNPVPAYSGSAVTEKPPWVK